MFQLQRMLGFFVWWHAVLLFKVGSNYAPLHHLGTTQKKSSNRTANHQAPLTPRKLETERPKSKWGEQKKNNTRRLRCYWICSSSRNWGGSLFILVSKGEGRKINRLFTSSWIFFPFSFCSELETGFDLLPSKLMYKPPSSFTLMPGSIRLDISFLKQIGNEKSPLEGESRIIFHLCTHFAHGQMMWILGFG